MFDTVFFFKFNIFCIDKLDLGIFYFIYQTPTLQLFKIL